MQEFERAGLQPAGESGYYQSVPLRVFTLRPDSKIVLVRAAAEALKINEQIAVTPRPGLPENIDANLTFVGADPAELSGKVAVVLAGTKHADTRDAVAVLSIDDPKGLEPPRWPAAYAKSMVVRGAAQPNPANQLRFNPKYGDVLLAGSGHSFSEIVERAAAGQPLPTFALPATLRATLHVEAQDIASDNIMAVLPGGDLKDEYVAVSAHLDGYGIGTPVNGDAIYNGAFDDAACVAHLIELAADLKRSGKKLRRSLLFAVFTGEEKGLLGSQYFTSHFTVAKEKIVADINLDYIRPLFPLRILTALGVDESSLGDIARQVAAKLDIRIQPDQEPQRGLYRRSDQYNFIRAGIPGIAFIFGYEPGSREERMYRDWYATRYHKPGDDLKQTVDWDGAAKFDRFFNLLAQAVADAPERPRMR